MERIKALKFEDLEVWQKAHSLTLEIYRITKTLPKDERFGLISQMRRSAVSVAANIAEGFNKKGPKDKVNFYNIAQGSLQELRYYMILCKDLGYIMTNESLIKSTDTIGRMLNGLIASIIGKR